MSATIILASGSAHRLALLKQAGLEPKVVPSDLDERAVEAPLRGTGASPADLADILAQAKAVEVSQRFGDALVIGADQVLSLDGKVLHKPADMEQARRRLLALQGRTHRLDTAVALAQGGETLWRHAASAHLTLRPLTPPQIGRYLARAGQGALSSAGAYQIERSGIALMDAVDGDHFTIIGLPLLALLRELRARGAFDV